MSRADRLARVAELLRTTAPDTVTAAEIGEAFGVTVRTIERDLTSLREAGVPVIGTSTGYTVDTNHTLPGVHLSASEATAIVVALARNPGGRFAEANLTARRKVLGAMSTIDASAARRLSNTVHDIQATTDEAAPAAVIQDAVTQHRVVKIRYRAGDGTISNRLIEPVGLVSRDGAWNVIAWCRLGETHRQYRLDRIDEASDAGEQAPDRETAALADLLDQPNLFT